MKVALLFQPISMVGGIFTNAVQLKKGFLEIGVNCDIISVSKTGKTNQKDVIKVEGREISGQNIYDVHLGYSDSMYKEMQAKLRTYDFVIHEVIPHKNKSFTSTEWQRCFVDDVKNIVIWHDTLAKSYEWIVDVADTIWAHAGCQEKTKWSFDMFGYEDQVIIRHPMDTSIDFDMDIVEDFAMAPHQWKSWKRMDAVVQATVYQEYKTYTYNTGIICRYMKSKMEAYQKYIDIWQAAKEAGNHVHKGFISREELDDDYAYAKVVIDISRGELGSKTLLPNMNYSTLEGMINGCLPVVSFHEYEFPGFPQENPFVIDEKNVAASLALCVNEAISEYDAYDELLIKNRQFVVDNFDRKHIAQQFIDLAEAPKRKTLTMKTKKTYGLF